MTPRRTLAGPVMLLCVLAACSGPPSPKSGGSPGPAASAAASVATAEPVHIETNASGDKYVTVVQHVTGPGNRSRVAYALRAAASQVDILGSSSVGTFDQPHITFFDRAGKKLIADSPQAKITQRDKGVVMGGGVHAHTDDGSILTCDTLRYDGRTEKVHGQGHVMLTGQSGLTLSGNYLEGDVRLDNVRVAERPL